MWLLSTTILYLSIIGAVKSTVDFLQHPVKSCHVGDVLENACNKCLCTSKTVFECTPLGCINERTVNELEETEPSCVPNQLYVQNLITCICTKDGRWPHKSCRDTFQNLPPRNVITNSCEPDTYISIDCNVCRCGPDGKILNDRCTRNACNDDVARRSHMATSTVFSKCEDKYWYSLAPCQFCFCVNLNKLVCNTGNYYTTNLDLGSYKLNVCGKDLIKEAIELIPDDLRSLRTNSNETKNIIPEILTNSKLNNHKNMRVKPSNEPVLVNNVKKSPLQNINSVNISSVNSKEYDSVDADAEPQDQMKKPTPFEPRVSSTTTTSELITKGVEEKEERVDVSDVNTVEDPDIKTKEEEYDDESVGIELDFNHSLTTVRSPHAHSYGKLERKHNYEYKIEPLNINIPKALNKVFQMAIRKSMVTLSKRTECTPGATTVHDCNMCFCLKNGKLLCTNHKCIDGKKA